MVLVLVQSICRLWGRIGKHAPSGRFASLRRAFDYRHHWIVVPPIRAWSQPTKPSRSRVALTRELPHLNGEKLAAMLVEVDLRTWWCQPTHRHPCPVLAMCSKAAFGCT